VAVYNRTRGHTMNGSMELRVILKKNEQQIY